MNKHIIKFILNISIIIFSLGIGFVINNILIQYIINKLSLVGVDIVTLDPLEIINILVYGTFVFALILLSPWIVYKIYKYLSDALYEKERLIIDKLLKYSILPIIGAIIGVILTNYFILPFLLDMIDKYSIGQVLGLTMVIRLFVSNILIMACVFLLPIVIKILSKLEIVTKTQLKNIRKFYYMSAIILLAVITPTTDMFTLLFMLLPTIMIYEISLFTIK
jgi:sec-independent protein translocase protein TatC